jgi:glycosyltransferase involved in cell wall biosynthesis
MVPVPRVSVLIATYNWSSVLPFSIGSALRQTFTDFEVLVIGDGCTDDSEQVVATIGDPRVRWIGLPVNSGHQSAPNNEGLRQARGEIIAYLGHDDLWLPHHLHSCVETLDRSGADLAFGIMARVGGDGQTIRPMVMRPHLRWWGPPSSFAHGRAMTTALGRWRDHRELRVSPEADLLSRAAAAGRRFTFTSRLSGIKFPAAERRDVYKLRPWHEQAAWSARIEREPDLERALLAQLVVDGEELDQLLYRRLVQRFFGETVNRFRRRLARRWWGLRRRGELIAALRRYKGLERR